MTHPVARDIVRALPFCTRVQGGATPHAGHYASRGFHGQTVRLSL